MAYFKNIVTKEFIPNYQSAGQNHENALNMYLSTPGYGGKGREVEQMSTTQIINNGEIITTTFLCCDEDGDD